MTGHGHGWAAALLVTVLLAAPTGASEPRTLDRPHDPVVVRTGLLGAVPSRATASWRLYAARDGRLEPIPFQFDQRGRDGELVLSDDGREVDFAFDDDDELVFMAKDTGERVAGVAVPAGADAALELDVVDPGRAAHGWAYLVHFPDAPPARSPLRYVRFDPAEQEARALSYQVSYSREPSNFLTAINVPSAAGGAPESLVAGISMRIEPTFSLLLTTWRATFTEKSFSVVPDGLKNGPVRAIRRVRQSLDLGRMFPEIPNGKVSTYYYATSFTTPSTFSIPWLALKTLRDFRFASVDAFDAPGPEMRYWDAANPKGVPFTAADRPAAADSDHDWWAVSGNRGTCFHALVIPQQWRAWGVERGIVFQGGRTAADGRTGAGYSLLNMTKLRHGGAYRLDSAFVVVPGPYRPGDEAQALAALRAPLAVEVRVAALEGGPVQHATR